MRYRIHKKIETSLQTLWYHVHHATQTENELTVTLKAIQKALEKLASKEEVETEFEKKAS